MKLDEKGGVLSDQSNTFERHQWSCVFDRQTNLTWEVKSNQKGIGYHQSTYSWFEPDARYNGGSVGSSNLGFCTLPPCDTLSLITKFNQENHCGVANWRLPTREELRSIVDYAVPYPGPTIDTRYFPNTLAQFYWSSTPDAGDKDSAWGIGFAFGYDYAYFKNTAAWVRLVHSSE
jgi:hypothetical protein